ncbi:HNH endonuclease signature motif containing protein [Actinomycetospora soli]|uniref:HNH endonuclease signature motif containing protein n=1 Tax=Actinomycetospora soli TaxID=2893887 RepID=UPI001E425205|nr:HNH endonuclease signature motif containing protein [Actinomycetospora soli]MCD2189752.1 HNH endonuclease [Actinomycetospora soli]
MAAVVGVETPGGDPFAGIPAGPGLAAALAQVSPAELTGQHAAAWMRAAFRQRNHDDVVFLDALRQTCRARADDCRRVLDDGFAPKAAAANLGWSPITASARYGLACFVLDAQPALGEAMYAGLLEERKADIFDSATEGLEDHQVAEVVRIVLPEAPGLAYQALRERILEVARALDPEWAAGRLAAAVARARVAARTSPSGAVDLCGYDLRPDLAQDAKSHLDALAVAVQARLAVLGVDLGVGFLCARIFTRLLDGTLAGLDDSAVTDAVVAEFAGHPDSNPDDNDPDDNGPDDDPDDPDRPDDPDSSGPDDSGPGSDDLGGGTDGSASDGSAPDGSAPDGSAPDGSGGATSATDPAPVVVPHPAGVALRMRLSTLLGHDERPAELPGLGGTLPEIARRRAHDLGAARWHVLVHDHQGRLTHLLVHRAPPGAHHDPRHHRRTVEITAPETLLDELDTTATHDPWLADLLTAHRRSRAAAPEDHPATTDRDADRRLPGAALARWIDARDPVCVAPGCTALARRCEHDHTLDWHHGGRTRADGLANLCPAHHAAKHRRGWTYHQPTPGHFEITDPTGTVHHTRSRVVRPLPDPLPAHHHTPVHQPAPTTTDYTPRPTPDGRITTAALATVEYLLARRPIRRVATPPPRTTTTRPTDR